MKLLLLFFTLPVLALEGPSTVQCQSYFSQHLGRQVRYCLHRTKPNSGTDEEPVVYFFHGINGGANSYTDNGYAGAVSQLANEQNTPATTFISFDTEGMSFFSDKAGMTTGPQSYESWFTREFVPYIENKYSWICTERKCRATLGVSMGGFGALKTALKHLDMFSATAVNCPALAPFSVYRPNSEWQKYFSRHPIGTVQGMLLLTGVRHVFTTAAQDEENDPAVIIQNTRSPESLPKMYFDVGGKDYFGFQEGHQRFKYELVKKFIPYESYYDPMEGHEIFQKTNKKAIEFLINYFQFEMEEKF